MMMMNDERASGRRDLGGHEAAAVVIARFCTLAGMSIGGS